jgi:hypothetical protein
MKTLSKEQYDLLSHWKDGKSIHHPEYGCVPDFSCCHGELAPDYERKGFYNAIINGDNNIITEMMQAFIIRANIRITDRVNVLESLSLQ